jgi:hypothetical protein
LSFKLNRNSLGHYTKNEETGADGEGWLGVLYIQGVAIVYL